MRHECPVLPMGLVMHHPTGELLMKNKPKETEVILDVDTHLDVHVGAVISKARKLAGVPAVSKSTAGYRDLLSWASSFGNLNRAWIEGVGTYSAGTYDAGLCRFLIGCGLVNSPMKQFFISLKPEWVPKLGYRSQADAQRSILGVLTGYYCPTRSHQQWWITTEQSAGDLLGLP
jgi:hypothetical protein